MGKLRRRHVRYVGKGINVGFISFRIAGTDGVSLETKKWADVLEEEGLSCYYMAAELDTPEDRSFEVPEADFRHPGIQALYRECFDNEIRTPSTTAALHRYRESLKTRIYEFVEKFAIDLLIPENVLAIPLNLPLSMALTEVIAETNIPTLAHHHDFFWERKRFLHNCVWDILNACFPPHLDSVQHVVINSSARNQLALRTGISSTLIPNVMKFEDPPNGRDKYNADVRQDLGLEDDELLILQPTRVVQRKGIEHAVELVAHLGLPARLVISHASGDEGYEYENRVRNFADLLNVNAVFVSDIIGERRGMTPDGRKIYSLQDIYPYADLVTYPSIFEGFGNAFLEAIYFRKPIFCNRYTIFRTDIEPCGFQAVVMDGYLTDEVVDEVRRVLTDKIHRQAMVEQNYLAARSYFSFERVEHELRAILDRPRPR